MCGTSERPSLGVVHQIKRMCVERKGEENGRSLFLEAVWKLKGCPG